MLLSEYPYYINKINAEDNVFIQPKLNGWRAIINTKTGIIYSRSGRIITLPHISKDILSINNLPEWLDGELYIHTGNADTIHSAIAIQDTRIKFYCFDCITDDIQADRINAINKIKETENIRIVSTVQIKPEKIHFFYMEYLKMGLEGAVIRLNTYYENRRSRNIFKLKPVYN